MNHYIYKINNGHGVQFSHVELPDGQTPLSGFTLDYPKIAVGPEPPRNSRGLRGTANKANSKRASHYSVFFEIGIRRLVSCAGRVSRHRILYLPTG